MKKCIFQIGLDKKINIKYYKIDKTVKNSPRKENMQRPARVKGIFVAVTILTLLTIPKAFSQSFKAGVVDIEKIYASYEKVKQSTEALQAEKNPKQEQYNKMLEEIKKMEDDYRAKATKMTLSERKTAESKIKAKKLEAQSFLEETNAALMEKNRAITQQRLKEISDAIQEYAKANKFDVVFDKKNLPYFTSTIDITEAIISKLNKK